MEAQPSVSKETISTITELGDQASADLKSDAQAVARLTDYLRSYSPANPENRPDMLLGRFRIDLASPLPQFDAKTARAYVASDSTEPSRSMFAHVCDPGVTQRHRVIQALKTVNNQNFTTPIAAGVIELSRPEEERFVIFFSRPPGKKLSEILASQPQGYVNQHFLIERVLAPVAAAIHQCEELGISHGLINPDNIYFADHAVVGPCVSEPCGFAQSPYFESIERMQAMPTAKGEGSTSQDYYALAVLALYIIHGARYFTGAPLEKLVEMILREGVYNAMIRHIEVPEIFYDFFRGVFSQNPDDRWDYHYIKPWLDGKRFNMLPPPVPAEAIRPFETDDQQIFTRRELAHMLSRDWEKMIEPVQSGKLTQWVTVSLRSKEVAEVVTRVSRNIAEINGRSELQTAEQFMRLILALDPCGPIRFHDLSFHIDGLDTLVADYYHTKAHQELQLIAKFIEFNMSNYWLDQQRKNLEYVVPAPINSMTIKLDRLRNTIRNPGYGFGLERMLYDLNPDMRCLSPMLGHSHVTTLESLLRHLDKLAPSLSKNEDPIDRHIAAFIASKLSIQHEIRLHELAGAPALANHRAIMALNLLSQAQQKVGSIQLPGLTHWIVLRIMPVLDTIHSRTLRHQLKTLLTEQAPAGYTQLLGEIVINTDYATSDQSGYTQAWTLYQNNAARIAAYRKGTLIDHQAARVGYAIARMVAYCALLTSFLTVLRTW